MVAWKLLRGLPILAQLLLAGLAAALLYFAVASFLAYWFGNDDAETEIEGARAGAAVESAQDAFKDLADLDDVREENARLIDHTEELLARAKTQAEKDAIAQDAMCQIDPEFCVETEE